MAEDFYTSTEASEITGCTRRQLQYWREQNIVIPTVNSTGKGHSVYYNLGDLVALSIIKHYLDAGLNFNTAKAILGMARKNARRMFKGKALPPEKQWLLLLYPNAKPELLSIEGLTAPALVAEIVLGRVVVPIILNPILASLFSNVEEFELKQVEVNASDDEKLQAKNKKPKNSKIGKRSTGSTPSVPSVER